MMLHSELARLVLAQTAEHHPPETVFEIVFAGGWVGITIMVLIILCSIAALALAIEQLVTLRASMLMPLGLGDRVQQQLAAGNLKGAFQACEAQPSFLAFLLRASLAEAESGWTAVEKALEDATAEQLGQTGTALDAVITAEPGDAGGEGTEDAVEGAVQQGAGQEHRDE